MSKVRGLRWWMIGLIMLGSVINYLTRSTLSVAAPTLMQELHIGTQQYSWVVGAFQGAIMLQPICGYVLDVIGLKRGYALFAVAWSLISMTHGLAHNWQMLAGDRVNVGGTELTWHAVDTLNYNVNLFHFARARGKKTSNVLFWAVTVINSPHEMRDVRLSIGSNAASVWWINGQEVVGIYGDRQTVIDDGVSRRLTLHKGPNVVRAAIVNGGGATDFCARFLDAEDKPLKEITVSLDEVRAKPSPAKTRRQSKASHPTRF